jgi:hypothetical protein
MQPIDQAPHHKSQNKFAKQSHKTKPQNKATKQSHKTKPQNKKNISTDTI